MQIGDKITFSKYEWSVLGKKKIPTTVVNSDNPWFNTIGGDYTVDKIFY